MLLGDKLIEILKRRGIVNLHVDKSTLYKLRDSGTDYFQWLSIMLLEGKARICLESDVRGGAIAYERGGVRLLHRAGDYYTNVHVYWYSKSCRGVDITDSIREELRPYIDEIKRKILFIIDVSFWHEHTEIEKKELIEQIILTIKTVRKYLHDSCLAITSCSREFLQYFENATRGMRHSVIITELDLRNFLKKVLKLRGNIAMLDPEGEFVLNDVDVLSYNVYIMGGIIDKERVDKFGTYRLYNMYRLWELNIPRFRIALDGSVIGVPDRLNKIAEIIIEAKLFKTPIINAIIKQQSKRDRIYRWMYEIQKHAKKSRCNGKIVYIVTREFIQSLKQRYPLDDKSIRRIFKSLNIIVEE